MNNVKTLVFEDIKNLYIPPASSHKGQNGRLLIIGGSHLFHAASIWALTVASRIVDLVHYASVPENAQIVLEAKKEFRNGIVIARKDIESYIQEDDCILIGPGMVRTQEEKFSIPNVPFTNMKQIEEIEDEGIQTAVLTNYLLKKYPHKQWVIDAGALQMMDIALIPPHAILTPHQGEFEGLWNKFIVINKQQSTLHEQMPIEEKVKVFAKTFQCIVLYKGPIDIVCTADACWKISGGNAGMTKGGTGDVLAGLITALATKNDPLLATLAGSYINKHAGDALYTTVGPFFHATDLANEIPKVMNKLFIKRNTI